MSNLPADLIVQVSYRDRDCGAVSLPQHMAIQEALDLSADTDRPIWLIDAVTNKIAATCVRGQIKAVRS